MSRSKVSEINSARKIHIEITHPRPEHYQGIQELCKKVYPFVAPWAIDQLDSHRSYFPGGQLIALDIETGAILGVAFSLILAWDDYSPRDNWSDFTSGGYFHNHSPKKGKTLYGAEVMVDPDCRGQGIGKRLYEERVKLAKKYELKRIRAGARLRGYARFKDQFTPEEYVIDVVKNYMSNDPESLGYAAVIEWPNYDKMSAIEIKKMKERVDSFLLQKKYTPEFLTRELRRLVRKMTLSLGEVIKDFEGDDFFQTVESYRTSLKKMRKKVQSDQIEKLHTLLQEEKNEDQFKLAHAFALHLELINCCEAAYRTWLQRKKVVPQETKNKIDLNFVLTAHPTEARSPVVIDLLQRFTEILIQMIDAQFQYHEKEMRSILNLLWRLPLCKASSPSVHDEAEYIFSLVFSPKVFDFIVSEKANFNLKLRTWVGGDKDGHPGVNEKVMKDCLTLSRSYILNIIKEKIQIVLNEIQIVKGASREKAPKDDILITLRKELDQLFVLKKADGNNIKKWIKRYQNAVEKGGVFIKEHHQNKLILQMIHIFPAFVMPIELREDAGEIEQALSDKKAPIRLMIMELKNIAGALGIHEYARGLVISHCEEARDIENAMKLVQLAGDSKSLPIIPLFESREALISSSKILKALLKNVRHVEQVKNYWSSRFEVMLGYSDSAKEIGVLPSRNLIHKTMFEIEKDLRHYGLTPLFFHGSGGSSARGGGSLREQISWWSQSAILNPKMTLQGEMIQRTFASKEILNSQCTHLAQEANRRKIQKVKYIPSTAIQRLSSQVEEHYKKLLNDKKLFADLLHASPFDYLSFLKIGSRPAKRIENELSISSLRAIPWILCWTQTRSLLPNWWGVGSSWANLSDADKKELKKEFSCNPFFISFIKSLAFTLEKVEMDIWKVYLQKNDELIKDFFPKALKEYKLAKKCVQEITGEKKLLWYRRWLEESIRLRSPHIHLLNLLQIEAMKREDEKLMRETLVGVACGMLTTG
jgi:phosphoenolpyruvate carboxylase